MNIFKPPLMRNEVQRMSRLVHSLLELSRLEAGGALELRPVNVATLAESLVAQLRPQAEAGGLALGLRVAAALPAAIGDADRLRQVLLILLDNALKYARPGDRVEVRLDAGPEGVTCAVCDTGPGIPAAHLPHLGRRFFRAHASDAIEGSGLGLALATAILRRHGSRLEIESQSAGAATGTCVRFILPAG